MKFKKNQTVKVFCTVGLQKQPTWQKATYQGSFVFDDGKDIGYLVKLHSKTTVVTERYIKRFDEITWEEVISKCKPQFNELCSLTEKALSSLCPNVKLDKIEKNDEDLIFSVMNGNVSISPEWGESECLGVIRQVPVWGVTIYHHIPATFHEPDDVSEVPKGQANGIISAVGLFVKTIFDLEFSNYMECLADNQTGLPSLFDLEKVI